jgi:hypothetical protein
MTCFSGLFPKEFTPIMEETYVRLDDVVRYYPLIIKYASENRIAPSLICGLMTQESGGNPNIISDCGAVGLMQIMPSTYIAGRPTKQQLLDPEFNISYGCRLLHQFRLTYKTQAGMLSAYFGAVDSEGHPTNASDGSGATGWDYVRLVESNALSYPDADTGIVDEDFAPYGTTWRQVAINLLGVCNDALETGRKIRDYTTQTWGER